MRILTIHWLIATWLSCSIVSAQGAPVAAPLTLAGALDRAMMTSPAIVAARARRAIGTAGVAVAGERLNPEVRAEFDRDTPRQGYTLAVPWETGGKRNRRVAIAEATVRTTDAEIAQVIAETRNAVRRAFFDLTIATARVALFDELQMLSVRVRDAAQQRFDAGGAPRLEVLQAELALAQAQNESTAARGTAAAASTQLNALLGFPLDAAIGLASPDLENAVGFEAAMARARGASAELALIDRRIEEQRARLALARAMRTPDLTPEAGVTRGFGGDAEFQTGWRAAIGVALPVFTTHKAGVMLEESTLGQLTFEREATLTRITGDVAAATSVATAQREQFRRYRDQIIPQALDVERMAEDSYRLGQTNIAAYLQALQATRDVRLRSLQAQADLQTALTDLERAMGTTLLP